MPLFPLMNDLRTRKWQVAPVRAADIETTGSLLGAAFVDDPVIAYYFPDNASRLRLCTALLTVATSLTMKHGHALVLSEGGTLRAATLILPPSTPNFPLAGIIRHLAATPSLWRPRAILRHFGVTGSVDGVRPQTPHWTLMTLGVDPACQGRGIGSYLLRSALASITGDEEVFLETYNESNLPFYRRHGFALDHTFRTHDGRGPQCWTMRRAEGGAACDPLRGNPI